MKESFLQGCFVAPDTHPTFPIIQHISIFWTQRLFFILQTFCHKYRTLSSRYGDVCRVSSARPPWPTCDLPDEHFHWLNRGELQKLFPQNPCNLLIKVHTSPTEKDPAHARTVPVHVTSPRSLLISSGFFAKPRKRRWAATAVTVPVCACFTVPHWPMSMYLSVVCV